VFYYVFMVKLLCLYPEVVAKWQHMAVMRTALIHGNSCYI